MATSSSMSSSLLPKPTKNCVRSISLPTRSHPSTLKFDEELNKLKTWETTIAPVSPFHYNAETIQIGLCGVKDVYDCVQDVLIQLPINTQKSQKHEKLVDEVLDGSVRLMDVCDTTRNILVQSKENVRNVQYGLRRRGSEESNSFIDTYTCCRKKMKKEMVKCIGELKKIESKFLGSSLSPLLLDQDQDQEHLAIVIRVLREVSSITISVFRSLLLYLSLSKPNTSKWSLVSKLLNQKGQLVSSSCHGKEDEMVNEFESVDLALNSLTCKKNISPISTSTILEEAKKKLNGLEMRIEGLEEGLGSMFKCLIKTRVSLLNNLSLSQ